MGRAKGKHLKSKSTNKKIRGRVLVICFRIISIVIVAICIGYIAMWLKEAKHNDEILEAVQDAKVTQVIDNKTTVVSVDFEKLKNTNSETVGWIKVNNTKVDYPVVQTSNNDYYLKHSFDKSYNSLGWIFMDYRIKRDETDKNMTIYGHNSKNDAMFGSLKDILKEEWYSNSDNLNVTYIDENGTHTYKVFSIYQIKKETYYTTTYFSSDDEFKNFIDTLKGRSIVDFGVDVGTEDQILTLSTCADNNNYRIVLHAKKI